MCVCACPQQVRAKQSVTWSLIILRLNMERTDARLESEQVLLGPAAQGRALPLLQPSCSGPSPCSHQEPALCHKPSEGTLGSCYQQAGNVSISEFRSQTR